MKWTRKSYLQSDLTPDEISSKIVSKLELEKTFFLHQVIPFPFFMRKNKFEGVMKKGKFQIYGQRTFLGFYIPHIISTKGVVSKHEKGTSIELQGDYNIVGKYFVEAQIIMILLLIINALVHNQFDDLLIPIALNAIGCFYIFPLWANWNFETIETKINKIITEQNVV